MVMQLPNHTQVSNSFIEELQKRVNDPAVRCYLAICRKTIGWHKLSGKVSYSQLRAMTGLSKDGVASGVASLEEAHLVEVTREPGRPMLFDLIFDRPAAQDSGSEVTVLPDRKDLPAPQDGTVLPHRMTKEIKETIKRNIEPMPKFSFTLEDGFVGIPYEDLQRWADTYPAVNIAAEIKKAAEWMRSNPTKRKSNYRRFLTNWFSRTQEHGGTAGYRPAAARPAAPQLVKPEPLTDSERKENLSALSELTRQMAKEKRVLPAGGKR
jgi:phage replication O-like protein O